MLRLILIVLMAAAGSAGGIWGGYVFANLPKDAASAGDSAATVHPTVFLTPEIFVAPLVNGQEIVGFLVCRFAFGVDPAIPSGAGIDDDTLLADLFYEAAFNGSAYKPGETKVPDLSAVADKMLFRMNEITGDMRFTSALIQQVDLFSRSEVRRKVVEERLLPAN